MGAAGPAVDRSTGYTAARAMWAEPSAPPPFGLIVIGDEILLGRRQERHFAHFRDLLAKRGLGLGWHWVLPDEPTLIIPHLRFSMGLGEPVFVCGGIGATPDDHTRACAAAAAGVALVRHPEAVLAIEARFGQDAYPHRILMAELPAGASLISNPYNQIPGFSLRAHYFLPGFPEMAWPMADWVLNTHFPKPTGHPQERSLWVIGMVESGLLPLMTQLTGRFPEARLFSLPRLGAAPCIELGFRGGAGVEAAFGALKHQLEARGISYQLSDPEETAAGAEGVPP